MQYKFKILYSKRKFQTTFFVFPSLVDSICFRNYVFAAFVTSAVTGCTQLDVMSPSWLITSLLFILFFGLVWLKANLTHLWVNLVKSLPILLIFSTIQLFLPLILCFFFFSPRCWLLPWDTCLQVTQLGSTVRLQWAVCSEFRGALKNILCVCTHTYTPTDGNHRTTWGRSVSSFDHMGPGDWISLMPADLFLKEALRSINALETSSLWASDYVCCIYFHLLLGVSWFPLLPLTHLSITRNSFIFLYLLRLVLCLNISSLLNYLGSSRIQFD